MKVTFAEVRKAVVALVGLLGEAVNAGLVSGTAARWAALVIAAVTFAGVYTVPNAVPPAGK